MKRSQIQEGMVFGVSTPDDRLALVQLIKKDKPIFYMAGFDILIPNKDAFVNDCLGNAGVLFLGNFFDDMIKSDQWVYLGKAPLKNVPFPNTRVLISEKWVVESWDRKKWGKSRRQKP